VITWFISWLAVSTISIMGTRKETFRIFVRSSRMVPQDN
jgi:hypothetical protein